MSEHAVFVEFGGTKTRIGTAYQQQDGGFVLVLGGTLSLGPGQASTSRGGAAGASGVVFPNYGRSKGAPIHGAAMQELEYYAANARKSLNDPSKARWHDKERQLLDAIEDEMRRQGFGGSEAERDSREREERAQRGYGSTRDESDDIPF